MRYVCFHGVAGTRLLLRRTAALRPIYGPVANATEADLQPWVKTPQRSPAKPPFAALAKRDGGRLAAVRD